MPDGATARAVPAYADAVARFRIDTVAAHLHGDLEHGLNACVECCDRHASGDAVALDWIDIDGAHRRFTFAQMKALAARVANLLVERGVKPGDVVAGLLPRTPELVATILGTWRAGAVYQPLFTAFGPKAIEHRLRMSDARLVVTNVANRAKLDEVADCPPVATVRAPEAPLPDGDIDFRAALDAQSDTFEPVLRKGTDLFMMMSTSGTTGLPKGVPVPLRALLAFRQYMCDAVDLRAEDRFWNIADPGLGIRTVLRDHRTAAAWPRDDAVRRRLYGRQHLRRDRTARHYEPRRFADGVPDADGGRLRCGRAYQGQAARGQQRG
ncbi:Acetyl-coenzyme A synthetase [Burkholderia multivorans]|nr:Acetyl-coenzyme A synthetase [Burkholderia multivorans]